jgi:D-3-phosphoglycerate dehydrogenase / 2-oxoglutarate reductase
MVSSIRYDAAFLTLRKICRVCYAAPMNSLPCTLVFDFDSTLIDNETLELLAEIALQYNPNKIDILARVAAITDRGMNGEISLEQGFRERFSLLSLTRAHVLQVTELLPQHLTTATRESAAFFRTHAAQIYVVSGGFRECILPTTRILGIPDAHVFGNVFVYDGEYVTGLDSRIPTSHSGGKRDIVSAIVHTTPAIAHPVIMVGDGMSDAQARAHGAADVFIAYTEIVTRDAVVTIADTVCTDMKAVIDYALSLTQGARAI